ncbi:hypothetical protein PspS35_17060 [Pseudomonas sp. S35]|nr:hypothetical protein PspS35_17060 [Pseudomonas sp. S35]
MRMPPAPSMPDRDVIRVIVADENLYRTMELFHELARQNGISKTSVGAGKPYVADYNTPEQKVWPVSIKFFPDRPDDTFTPVHLENVNNFGKQVNEALSRAGIVKVIPVD